MKRLFVLFILFSTFSNAQNFKNVLFLDQWKNDALLTSSSKVRYNECWGFTMHAKEYAVLGSTEGVHFFEISVENKLIEKDFVKGRFSSAQVVHRDFKNYGKYLYAICDEGNSSLQIIDLSYLPDSVHLVADASELVGRAHNLFIDSANALLYVFSVTPIIAGQAQSPLAMRVFSLSNPILPSLVYSGPDDIAEVHDGYIRDNIAILNCGMDGLRRYDFSTPTNPLFIQNIPFYQEQGYNHQGWLNPKGDVYIFADETEGKKLKKCSVDNNGNIQIESYFGAGFTDGSVPHNVMVDDQFAYVAYYNYGLRIFDYTKTPIEQLGFWDTYPDQVTYQMNGAWGVYSQLPSKRILISDRQYGLFLFEFNQTNFKNRNAETLQYYPNPVKSGELINLFLNSNYAGPLTYSLADQVGNMVLKGEIENFNHFRVPMNVAAGMYVLTITYTNNLEMNEEVVAIVVN
jgi:choice-of-anchor B domain-containing protein